MEATRLQEEADISRLELNYARQAREEALKRAAALQGAAATALTTPLAISAARRSSVAMALAAPMTPGEPPRPQRSLLSCERQSMLQMSRGAWAMPAVQPSSHTPVHAPDTRHTTKPNAWFVTLRSEHRHGP